MTTDGVKTEDRADDRAGDHAGEGSARRRELLRRTLEYTAENSLSDLSLRPLAKAIGSSPRVLIYLFGSKHGLIREVLAIKRVEQLALLRAATEGSAGAREALDRLWAWLISPSQESLWRLFFEAYVRSVDGNDETWEDFAVRSVDEWLAHFMTEIAESPDDPDSRVAATLVLAVLRGLFLDVMATRDTERATAAWRQFLDRHYPA